jgi:ATP-binding cassette subfamily B protein
MKKESPAEEASKKELEAYLDVEERREQAQKTVPSAGNLRRLVYYTCKSLGPLSIGLVMILLGTAATLLEPRIFGYAIDEAIVPKKWDLLKPLTAIFFTVTLVRVVAAISQAYFFELLGQRVTQVLRCELFSHLQRLPVELYDKNPAGRLLTRVTNDIGSLGEMYSAGFVSMIGNALIVIGIMVWMLILDLRLGLIAASVFPVLLWISVVFSQRLRIAYRESRSKLSALNAFLAENLMGMKVVHLFNREKLHLERFDRINEWYAEAQIATIRVFAYFQPAITWSAGISVALVIYFGGLATWNGGIKVGVLVTYFSYVLSLFQPMREIADKWNVFLSGMASAERIFSILDWPVELPEDQVKEKPKSLAGVKGHIVFENVWFAYEGERWVLKDFCLEIQPGRRLGIVGHTGSGKTTLIALLMRFYEPQKGRILLDGVDIRTLPKRELRASIGFVQQDVFLFSGSFADNVNFWEPMTPELEAIVKDLMAGAHAEGESLALYERGANVSMGQRQVLAFARAIAAKPKIWILDEATANMDSETEGRLQGFLDRASKNQTSLLIAHRLATIRSADQIIVLHKGTLVENGSHRELMQKDGLYSRLYRYQEAQERSELAVSTEGRNQTV